MWTLINRSQDRDIILFPQNNKNSKISNYKIGKPLFPSSKSPQKQQLTDNTITMAPHKRQISTKDKPAKAHEGCSDKNYDIVCILDNKNNLTMKPLPGKILFDCLVRSQEQIFQEFKSNPAKYRRLYDIIVKSLRANAGSQFILVDKETATTGITMSDEEATVILTLASLKMNEEMQGPALGSSLARQPPQSSLLDDNKTEAQKPMARLNSPPIALSDLPDDHLFSSVHKSSSITKFASAPQEAFDTLNMQYGAIDTKPSSSNASASMLFAEETGNNEKKLTHLRPEGFPLFDSLIDCVKSSLFSNKPSSTIQVTAAAPDEYREYYSQQQRGASEDYNLSPNSDVLFDNLLSSLAQEEGQLATESL